MLALVTLGPVALGLVAGLVPAAWAAGGGSGPSTGAAAERVPVCSAEPAGVAHCLAIQLLHPVTNWHGTHLPHAVPGRSPSGKLDTVGASPAASEATPPGYLPAELQSAYALASISASAGGTQTVAIVDAYDDPNAESDLNVYRSYSKLAPCTTANGCFKKVNQQGASSYPRANSGWAEEISLDLDMVSAICPNCHILLVEASSSYLTDLGTAVNEAVKLGANAISNSYAGAEFSSESGYDQYYAHAGVAITASAGDSGYGVEYPSSSSFVTAVGGTTLAPAATARGWSETVWSGTGSGCSAYEPRAEWQPMTSECAKRTVADVAADANPNTGVAVYDSFHTSGWLVFGGTSVSSPIVASVYALAGGTSSFTVSSTGSDAARGLYTGSSLLNKVTSGANASGCSVYLCNAADSLFSYAGHEYFGYNGPTGNGTPDGIAAFKPRPPTVVTGAASAISQTSATLGATVNPNGGEVSECKFEYGTTESYGSSVPCSPSPGSGESPVAVSGSLMSLAANTTYHYRIRAANGGGTSYGSDQTFKTLAAISAPTVSSVSPASGTVNGGTNITITGTGFVAGATVEIGQGSGTGPTAIAASKVVVVSPTEITATTGGPAKAGTWNLFVIDSGGTSVANAGDDYTYQ